MQIFIPYFRSFIIPDSTHVTPVGCAGYTSEKILLNTNSGDSIDELNTYWNEYTSLYWILRNVQLPNLVGFMHYRKFFALEFLLSGNWAPVLKAEPSQELLNRLCSEQTVKKYTEILQSHDVIVPKGYQMNMSIRDQYIRSHGEREWYLFEKAVTKALPEYEEHLSFFRESNYFIFFGMMLTHRHWFKRYVSEVTRVLSELLKLEKPQIRPDETTRFRYHRYPAYLGERFFMLFLYANNLKKYESPVILLESTA